VRGGLIKDASGGCNRVLTSRGSNQACHYFMTLIERAKRTLERARRLYDTPLSRALWMTRDGFADPLRSGYY